MNSDTCMANFPVCMQVFDLGADGKEFRKVAEVTDFIKQAERAAGEILGAIPPYSSHL